MDGMFDISTGAVCVSEMDCVIENNKKGSLVEVRRFGLARLRWIRTEQKKIRGNSDIT